MVTKNPGILTHISPDLLERIDNYRYEKRFPTRSEAMRSLMEWALNIEDSGTEAMDHLKPERKA